MSNAGLRLCLTLFEHLHMRDGIETINKRKLWCERLENALIDKILVSITIVNLSKSACCVAYAYVLLERRVLLHLIDGLDGYATLKACLVVATCDECLIRVY